MSKELMYLEKLIHTFFKTTRPKIRHAVCQLSGVSTRFQVYPPAFRCIAPVYKWDTKNTRVNGAKFVINCHKTGANNLKS